MGHWDHNKRWRVLSPSNVCNLNITEGNSGRIGALHDRIIRSLDGGCFVKLIFEFLIIPPLCKFIPGNQIFSSPGGGSGRIGVLSPF